MDHIIVSIMDKATEGYGRPIVARSENDALRLIEREVNRQDETNMLYTHPQDFAAYKVGLWDDETGLINSMPNNTPLRLFECATLKK